MGSPTLYNLSVDSEVRLRSPLRVGLLRKRTGIPVFLLYLKGVEAPLELEVVNNETLESHLTRMQDPFDKSAWESLLPFFQAGGHHALVAVVPAPKTVSVRNYLGKDAGLKHRTGVHHLKNFLDWADIVSIPQAPKLFSMDQLAQFYRSTLELYAPYAHFFFLLDLPLSTTPTEFAAMTRGWDFPDAASYHPWVLYQDRVLPCSPVVAALYQRHDIQHGINHIPANRAIPAAVHAVRHFSPVTLREWNDSRVNMIHTFTHDNTRLWGGRTLSASADSSYRLIGPRRLQIAVKEAIEEIAHPFVMEPLVNDLAQVVEMEIYSVMNQNIHLFHPNATPPFRVVTEVSKVSGQDVLNIEFSYSIPYSVDEVTFSLGLTG